MTLGLVGRKVGMTRLFTDEGDSVAVTVVDVSDNRVAQIKTAASDGYSAVQVAFGKRRASRVTKALAGHFAKAGTEAGSVLGTVAVVGAVVAPPLDEHAAAMSRALTRAKTLVVFRKGLSIGGSSTDWVSWTERQATPSCTSSE